jgi:hypothetical protein
MSETTTFHKRQMQRWNWCFSWFVDYFRIELHELGSLHAMADRVLTSTTIAGIAISEMISQLGRLFKEEVIAGMHLHLLW